MREFLEGKSLGFYSLIASLLTFIALGNFASALALTVCALVYSVERFDQFKRDEMEQKSHDMNMVMLQNQIDELKREQESVKKIAREMESTIATAKMANSFVPKSMRI